MVKLFRNKLLLSVIVVLLSIGGYGQTGISEGPPEPQAFSAQETSPCVDPDGDGPLTPPPGLCMPINDYIIPLLFLGIIYGVYKIGKIEQV